MKTDEADTLLRIPHGVGFVLCKFPNPTMPSGVQVDTSANLSVLHFVMVSWLMERLANMQQSQNESTMAADLMRNPKELAKAFGMVE